jgi:hypothetical protein
LKYVADFIKRFGLTSIESKKTEECSGESDGTGKGLTTCSYLNIKS